MIYYFLIQFTFTWWLGAVGFAQMTLPNSIADTIDLSRCFHNCVADAVVELAESPVASSAVSQVCIYRVA